MLMQQKVYDAKQAPFIWGVQYYRAPTPDKRFWRTDFENIRALGFTDVKFWVQWRWSSRCEGEFYFDDIDELMDLAAEFGLRVTLNVIFDVAPTWFLNKYPQAMQELSGGGQVQPYASVCRQLGGMPGPCYNHEQGILEREKFLRATVARYAQHPAMFMWDVWNEPEQCHKYRHPKEETLTCYCPTCRQKFIGRMKERYGSIDRLNTVWGKCFVDWDELELPRNRETVGDFLDYREFQLDTMTQEATRRISIVKSLDKQHAAYLHVVPNTSSIFNAVTGVDDFALAKPCDVFASTNFSSPIWSILTLSAANGKPAYNVECHMGTGSTLMHPKFVEYADVVRDFVPQLGLGIRGFMYWQYHAELLGLESPAWGVALPDGSVGSIGHASQAFFTKLKPYVADIMAASPPQATVAIWKGRRNELFSFAVHEQLQHFADGVKAYVNFFYENNYPCKVIDDALLCTDGLQGVKLLVLPHGYAFDAACAAAVNRFVAAGGSVLSEAHLGGYDMDSNRHSERMPGCGLAHEWNLREVDTTSSYHLPTVSQAMDADSLNDDVKKAIEAYGLAGGKYFVIRTVDGCSLLGAERFAELTFAKGEALGHFNDRVCIAAVPYGDGEVVYCGTDISTGATADKTGFYAFMETVCHRAGVKKTLEGLPCGVHIDRLHDTLWCVNNMTDEAVSIPLDGIGVFHAGARGNVVVAAKSAELIDGAKIDKG